jgi:hypothetical protein
LMTLPPNTFTLPSARRFCAGRWAPTLTSIKPKVICFGSPYRYPPNGGCEKCHLGDGREADGSVRPKQLTVIRRGCGVRQDLPRGRLGSATPTDGEFSRLAWSRCRRRYILSVTPRLRRCW